MFSFRCRRFSRIDAMRLGILGSRIARPALALALLLPGLGARAANPERDPAWSVAARSLERGVRVHRLSNGMTFLLLERSQAPIFSGAIRFKVGGLDEAPGRSGLAHLFEHLAFKGTSQIGTRQFEQEEELLQALERAMDRFVEEERRQPVDLDRLQEARQRVANLRKQHQKLLVPEEFSELYTAHGAVGLNAGTGKDLTTYFVSLPANRTELWCLMESERLRDGVLREFYAERDVVMEERRMRVESSPFGSLYEALLREAFGDAPYGIPTVGRSEDLRRLRTAQAEEFRRRHYRPENAVAALVGDFEIGEAVRLIERYFGDWKEEPIEAPTPRGSGRGRGSERDRPERVEIQFESQPYLLVAFHKPVHPHPDAVKFQVLQELLGGGRSARLYRRLVLERQMALEVFTFEGPGQRRDNLFIVGAIPQAPHSAKQVEAAILEELEVLALEPVGERELEKVRNGFQASFIRGLASNLGLALQLSYFQSLYGDWRELLRLLEQASKVTPDDLQTLAGRYLQPEHAVTAELIPLRHGNTGPGGAQTQESGP
ncbi:MAG: pitrilysin family protein [Acidobacteriota bacterium]